MNRVPAQTTSRICEPATESCGATGCQGPEATGRVGAEVSSGGCVGPSLEDPGAGVELEVEVLDPVGDSLGAFVQAAINIAVASIALTLTALLPRSTTRLPSFVSR